MTSIIETWASLYSNHAALRTGVAFFHIGGLVVAGGCAIAADRITLRAVSQRLEARGAMLAALAGTHRAVLIGLAAVIVSGLLMFGADVDTFLHSKFFWIKMGLMALLLVNGALLLRAERAVEAGDRDAWTPLAWTARASVVLWMLTTLVGAALPNVG